MHLLKPGLIPGLFIGLLLGVMVAGPYFHVWGAAQSVLVCLGCALVGGTAGLVLVALSLAKLADGPPAIAGDDELPVFKGGSDATCDPAGEVWAD